MELLEDMIIVEINYRITLTNFTGPSIIIVK